ncbi:MAG: flagellar basal body rod protein FlgC [Clostridiales bacterium]|nr:flagellar basal body rod protein FlgC [Clostridiales bacterium]
MSFLRTMDINASGMTAQRMRLDVVSENIANIETTRTESGGPYKRKVVVLETNQNNSFQQILKNTANKNGSSYGGVKVAKILEDQKEGKPVYDPTHPDANDEGYVLMPNVDLVKETVDGMSATRSYEANITAFNAVKLMAQKALEIGK